MLMLSIRWGLWYGLIELSVASLVFYGTEPLFGPKMAAGLFLVAAILMGYVLLPWVRLKRADAAA
jgi:hypothetical protein